MSLKTGIACIGTLVGIGVIAGLYFGLGLGWIFLGVIVGMEIVSYIVAAVGASSRTSTTGFGEFMRGWLLGLNGTQCVALGIGVVVAGALLNAGAPPAAVFAWRRLI